MEEKENNCNLCGDKYFKKVETPDIGWVNMCEGCYRSYMDCKNCNTINYTTSKGKNTDYHINIYHKKDPNRILYTLPYIVIILPIALIIIWIILESIGFIKRG